jgi:hypothetical protein
MLRIEPLMKKPMIQPVSATDSAILPTGSVFGSAHRPITIPGNEKPGERIKGYPTCT